MMDESQQLPRSTDAAGRPERPEKPKDFEETINAIKRDLKEIDGVKGVKTDNNRYAPFLLRLMGYVIDQVIVSAFTIAALVLCTFMLGRAVLDNLFGSVLLIFAPLNFMIEMFYFVYFHAITGRTFGKLLCGTRVVDESRKAPGFKKAFLRYIGYLICRLTLYIGFLWIVFDRNKQGWHDKIAKTYVSKEGC